MASSRRAAGARRARRSRQGPSGARRRDHAGRRSRSPSTGRRRRGPDDLRAEDRLQLDEEAAGLLGVAVEREAHPEAELRVVLEQRVAPGRAAAVAIDRPRRRRQVGAEDRRAARSRWRSTIRSPNSWLTRRRYGVSPQPLHAPENSNSGSRTWLPLIVSCGIRSRASGGMARNASQRARCSSRCDAIGSMLIALWPASVRLTTGQTSTHTPQPVQSSGATAIASRWSGSSRDLNALWSSTAGAASAVASGKTVHPDARVRADDRALAAVDADRRIPDRDRRRERRASRTGRSPWGTCRRAAARSRAGGRRCPRSAAR